jgi:hypothetical protein
VHGQYPDGKTWEEMTTTSDASLGGASVKLTRKGAEIFSGVKIEALRRFTEDVSEVRNGYECGIKLVDHDADHDQHAGRLCCRRARLQRPRV